MKKLFKIVFVLMMAGIVAGAVVSFTAKKRLEAMSDEEIRAYLASKLHGRVGGEQLATIQEATVSGIRKGRKFADSVGTIAKDAAEDVAESVEDAAEDAATA